MSTLPARRRGASGVALAVMVLGCMNDARRPPRECPADERCSSLVDDLFFTGTVPHPHDMFAIAQGGTERVRAQSGDGVTFVGEIFAGPFDARSSDTAILGIAAVESPELTLLGIAPGGALLRVLEPDSDLLLDRADIRVSAVDRVRVSSIHTSSSSITEEEVVAVWSGSAVRLVVTLMDAEGWALWDDSLRVEGHAWTTAEPALGLELRAVAPVSGSLEVMLVRDAEAHPFSLPVVTEATGIAVVPEHDGFCVTQGLITGICAYGRTTGGIIAGAPVEAALPPILSPAAHPSPFLDGELPVACIGFRADREGRGSITLRLGTHTRDIDITVISSSSDPAYCWP